MEICMGARVAKVWGEADATTPENIFLANAFELSIILLKTHQGVRGNGAPEIFQNLNI